MQTNPSVKQAYALPQGHRERLAATIQAVVDWRRGKAHEAEDAYQDKWARERSNRAFFALKILRTFVLFSLPDDDPDLGTFRYSAPQDDRYRICPETWDLLSRFCMARGNLQASGGKPTRGTDEKRPSTRRGQGAAGTRRETEGGLPRGERCVTAQPGKTAILEATNCIRDSEPLQALSQRGYAP